MLGNKVESYDNRHCGRFEECGCCVCKDVKSVAHIRFPTTNKFSEKNSFFGLITARHAQNQVTAVLINLTNNPLCFCF